jgi:hypothetical protein
MHRSFVRGRFILPGALLLAGLTTIASLPALAGDDPAAPSQVTLLDPGAAPLETLRYQLSAGMAQTLQMDVTTSLSTTVAGAPAGATNLPTLRAVLSTTVTEVDEAGVATIEFRIDSYEALPTEGTDPMLVQTLTAGLQPLVGISGTSQVDARGATLSASIDVPDTVDPALRQMFDSLERSMGQLSSPLPEEPVGVGARWQVVMAVPDPSTGLVIDQTGTFTLEALDGSEVTVGVELTQSAEPGPLDVPGLPAGSTAELVSMAGMGAGESTFSLDRPAPASTLTTQVEMVLSVTIGSTTQEVVTTTDATVEVAPLP